MGEKKMREERTPILGREVGKPLQPKEYPSAKEIASLTGEVGKSRIKEALGLALVSSGLVGLTVGCAREIIESTPPVEPTKVPTEVPTPTSRTEILPTPTVASIEITPREIGGVTGEEMSVGFERETQKLLKYTLSGGEAFFRLGLYPDLPNISESPDLVNEVVYYQDQPFVFLTTISPLTGSPEALPFYDRNVPEVGIVRWIEGGESVSQQAAFEQLQEDEVSVRFDSERGIYEFLDEAGNIARTKEVFRIPEPTPTPEPTETPTPEIQRVVYLEDNFSGTNRALFEGPNPRFENNALFFTFAEEGGGLLARARLPLSNFRLETRLSGNGAYGLTFGDFEGINYLLVLEKNGDLNLKKFLGEEYQSLRLNEGVTSKSGTEGFHDFGLDYDGKKLTLFFDGKEVGKVSEDLPETGRIGLFVWNEPEKDVWVGIDDLAIHLPQGLIPPTPTPAPPTPTETPRPPVCEIPYFQGRTPDRKNGYRNFDGKHYQLISPEGISEPPHYQWFDLDIFGIYAKVTKRDGRIIAIDRENQIITFNIGGLIVQRRFTENTEVLMWANQAYRGMPATESLKRGGNFCDLEVEDAAAILDPSVDVNPALIDLWGINITQ